MGTRDEEVDFLNRHITKENCLIEGPRGGMGHLWSRVGGMLSQTRLVHTEGGRSLSWVLGGACPQAWRCRFYSCFNDNNDNNTEVVVHA